MPLDLSGPNLEETLLNQAMQDIPVSSETEKTPKIGKWPWISLLAGQGADIGTTIYGMNNGYKESNPLL